MDTRCCLEIGGTSCLIRSNMAIGPPSLHDDRHYENFERVMAEPTGAAACDIAVSVSRGDMPALADYTQVSRTESWSLFFLDDRYAITLQPENTDRPVWTVLSDPSFSRVHVYLDENLAPHNPVHYPLDQILLMHHLALRQGTILHAAGFTRDGKGYIFPGVSGAGKTTLSRLLMTDSRFVPLSDDRIIVRRSERGYVCFGTPWPGEAGVAANRQAPLAGIYFLRQAQENRIVGLSPRAAFEQFMPISSIPWYHHHFVTCLLDFFQHLCREVPAYEFHFAPSAGVISCLEQFLAEQS